MFCYQRGYPVSPIQDTGMIPGWGHLGSCVWFPSAKHDRLGGPLVWFFTLHPGIRNSAHSSRPNLMQRQNTFPVLPLSYLHITQEGGHDLDIHGSLMASSWSPGALPSITLAHPISHYLTLSHPITPYLTLPHPISPYHTLSHPISPYLTLSHPISSYLTLSHPISPYITLAHIISHYLTLSHPFSPFRTLSHPISPYLTLSNPISPYLTISHPISPYLTLSHSRSP